MVMEASVGQEYRESYVPMLDQTPSTTEMTQMDDLVAVGCSGQ